ncbi:MAG: hypothetical protein GY797_17480 [Deltaproteobacteria bacterium]|nr:hypothetical protein [Deltaproteobacteria bacterium]
MMEENVYVGQRPLTDTHVDECMLSMEGNKFTHSQIIRAYCEKNPTIVFILDGQHRIKAVIEGEYNDIEVSLITYACETEEELSLLWKNYDGGKIRSLADMNESEARLMGMDWKKTIASHVAAGAVFLRNKTKKKKKEKSALLREYAAEGTFVNSIIVGSHKTVKHIKKNAVVAAMMVTFQTCPDTSDDFWIKIRTGEMLAGTDPRLHLREFLLKVVDGVYKGGRKIKFSDLELFNRCITIWNKYRQDTEMRKFTYKQKDYKIKAK